VESRTLFALVVLLVSILGGLEHGTRHYATKVSDPVRALALNRLWHRLLFIREGILGAALGWFAFETLPAAGAALTVYASWRWATFDTSHAIADGQPPLYAGSVADTDALLARLPVGARLALYLLACGLSATLLHHLTP